MPCRSSTGILCQITIPFFFLVGKDHNILSLDISYLREFVRFLGIEEIIPPRQERRSLSLLINLQKNVRKLRAIARAKSQEESKARRVTEGDIEVDF